MSTEDEAMKEYAEAGVDLPELKAEPQEETPKEPEQAPEAEKSEEEPTTEPLKEEPKETRPKRSIYDDYKSEKDKRKEAERERDEFKTRLEALESADTPAEKAAAQDDLEAFAREIEADPQALRRMREIFLKDLPATGLSDEDRKAIADLQAFKAQNQQVMEQQMFDKEFTDSMPRLQKLFPGASTDEMQAVRAELDKLSHTAEYHDKPLAYIAFEHQDTLATLISPKKRGMESRERTGIEEAESDFNPEADLSSMSASQREQWEKTYRSAIKREELATDASGRRVML